MKKNTEISVILTARNYPGIVNCIKSLLKQDVKAKYEIIVVYFDSSNNYKELEKMPIVLIKKDCNLGTARQICLNKAKGEILVVIDADCVVPGNYLSKIKKAFDKGEVYVGTYVKTLEKDFISQVVGSIYEATYNMERKWHD
ncbi:MAG: glycosyltransferase [Candidatus Aenigmarchaeota archaeon]|nr:glycosyltransferase [Candidatus Aenigmarchaeota archaeon]